MTEKAWDELSSEDKIEDLRKDLGRTMAIVNVLVRDHDDMRSTATSLGVELKHLTERVARLERKAQGKE